MYNFRVRYKDSDNKGSLSYNYFLGTRDYIYNYKMENGWSVNKSHVHYTDGENNNFVYDNVHLSIQVYNYK